MRVFFHFHFSPERNECGVRHAVSYGWRFVRRPVCLSACSMFIDSLATPVRYPSDQFHQQAAAATTSILCGLTIFILWQLSVCIHADDGIDASAHCIATTTKSTSHFQVHLHISVCVVAARSICVSEWGETESLCASHYYQANASVLCEAQLNNSSAAIVVFVVNLVVSRLQRAIVLSIDAHMYPTGAMYT